MYKSKRMISVLLLCAILASASCGSASGQTENTTAADNTTTTAASAETLSSEYVKPDVDYKGAEFRIMDKEASATWIAGGYYDIYAEEENGDPINDAQYRRNRQVEEELNIKLVSEFVPTADRAETLRKYILANDDVVDIAFIRQNTMKTLLGEPNLLYNINEIDTINVGASWWDQEAVDIFDFGGTLKCLAGDISVYYNFAPMLYFFNKNVAEDFGFTNLYDLVREGKWTFDKNYEMCRTVASDLNGDNKMDENDRFGAAVQHTLLSDVLLSGGELITKKNASGGVDLVVNNERAIKILDDGVSWLHDSKVNCVSQDYENKYTNVFSQLHIPMFKNNQLLFNYQQLLIAFELRAMEADYGIIPTPKYDESQENYITSQSSAWLNFTVVPATNSKLDMTGHVLDALGFYGQQYVTPEFIETTVRSKSLRDEDSAEMLEIILDSYVYDLSFIYSFGSVRTKINGLTEAGTFSSVYASMETNVKEEIKKTLETVME